MTSVEPSTDDRAPTLEDVARLAGVSRATVSRVVNGSALVAPAKQQAVQQAVHALGYRPNLAARTLVTNRSGIVAVLIPESDERVFSDPFFSQVYRGAIQAFDDVGTRVVLSISQTRSSDLADMVAFLGSGHVDGALVGSHHGSAMAHELRSTGRPVVFIGDPGVDDMPYVDLDQCRGAQLAADRLVGRGARRIATITGPLDMLAAASRRDAFRDRLAEAGLPLVAEADGGFTHDGAEQAAERLVAEHPDLDGLFVASDLMAAGALRALRRAGRVVPDDLALVGFDDSVVATQCDPPLTTVRNPAVDLARTAGQMLRAMLDGHRVESRLLEPSLVVRASA